jgi:capsular exopolysaccharide synthesis family protein
MSRIDEALRRTTGEAVASVESIAEVEPFKSPWQFDPNAARAQKSAAVLDAVHPHEADNSVAPSPSLGAPMGVTGFNPEWGERLAISPNANWALVEEFRRVAATLHQAQTEAKTRVVMITSAVPGDGKTLTAINLALILSESYRRRVLLIDADLRRPSIRDVSHMPNVVGLSDGLRSKTEQKLTLLPITKNLTLLPAGRPNADPMSGLTSSRMRRIVEQAASRFDWVILDAPPVGTIADSSLLVEIVDAVLLVVRAGRTQYPGVQKAIDALGRDRILGVVLNAVDPSDNTPYDRYYGMVDGSRRG